MTDRGAVVVTGAGRGIGRALAVTLATAGYRLVLVSRGRDWLEETRCLCAPLVATRALVADVRNASEVAPLTAVVEEVAPVHAVVNNAGVGEWARLEELSDEGWSRQLDTNVTGAFHVVRATLPLLRRQRRGLYLSIASDSALVGMAGRAAYNASKFALVGLSMSMRAELSDDGVHTSILYAGKTDTWFRDHRPGDRPGGLAAEQVAAAATFVIDQYPAMLVTEIVVVPRGAGASGPRTVR